MPPGAYLTKTDIKNAFRIVPVNPESYHLIGIKWNDQYFYDKTSAMGLSASCHILLYTYVYTYICPKIYSAALVWGPSLLRIEKTDLSDIQFSILDSCWGTSWLLKKQCWTSQHSCAIFVRTFY